MTTWNELEGFLQSKISQTEKNKYSMILLYIWNLKTKQNTTLIEKEIGSVVTRSEGWRVRVSDKGGQKEQTSSYKLSKNLGGCHECVT